MTSPTIALKKPQDKHKCSVILQQYLHSYSFFFFKTIKSEWLSQHEILHKISSQVTKYSNIWPINMIPQHSHTPRKKNMHKSSQKQILQMQARTYTLAPLVHVRVTYELISLRSSSGVNCWFKPGLC